LRRGRKRGAHDFACTHLLTYSLTHTHTHTQGFSKDNRGSMLQSDFRMRVLQVWVVDHKTGRRRLCWVPAIRPPHHINQGGGSTVRITQHSSSTNRHQEAGAPTFRTMRVIKGTCACECECVCVCVCYCLCLVRKREPLPAAQCE